MTQESEQIQKVKKSEQIRNFFRMLRFKITKPFKKKKTHRESVCQIFVAAKEGFVPGKENNDHYFHNDVLYVPTDKAVNDGDPYHMKNLKTGTIMVMNPKENEAYLLKKDPLTNNYKKVWPTIAR